MTTGAHPSVVLGAYLEPLVSGRRVALLGDATIGLAERIAERGARLVHAYDPDAARTAQALARRGSDGQRHVTYAVLEAELGVRDGAFDLVVVPDLPLFTDFEDILRRARRLVPSNGVVVVASRNPEASRRLVETSSAQAHAPSYYELYDLLSLQFSVVKMVGQAPFVGYSVVDFAPDQEPEVAVDTSLLGSSEEPELFIAIASERPVDLEAYALIQIPSESIASAGGDGVRSDDQAALAEAEARIAALSTELETVRERQRAGVREAQERAAHATASSSRLVEVERELEAKTSRLKDLEARTGDTHVRAERLTHELRDMEEELRRQRDRATRLTKQLDDEKKARTKADLELAMMRAKLEAPPSKEAPASVPEPADPRIEEQRRALEGAEERARESAASRDAALQRVRELEQLEGRLARERDEALERSRGLEKRCAELAAAQEDGGGAVEVDGLEAALRERAHVIAALQRDMLEGERVGKELLDELEALRNARTESDPEGDESITALRARLDTLAETAAKCEADLTAATWRVSQLERELEAARAAAAEPAGVQLELERALTRARQDLAAARASSGAGPSDPPPGVSEQSVLLHQVSSEI